MTEEQEKIESQVIHLASMRYVRVTMSDGWDRCTKSEERTRVVTHMDDKVVVLVLVKGEENLWGQAIKDAYTETNKVLAMIEWEKTNPDLYSRLVTRLKYI